MRRFHSYTIGVDQGAIMLFSDFQDGGEMWTGTGPREVRRSVSFSERFATPPVVQASLSLLDMDQNANQRFDLSVDEVTEEGFVLIFRTWGDTRVARARASWTALGELSNDDDWDIS